MVKSRLPENFLKFSDNRLLSYRSFNKTSVGFGC